MDRITHETDLSRRRVLQGIAALAAVPMLAGCPITRLRFGAVITMRPGLAR